MAAPVVQSLNDIVAQIGAAYKPQQDQLDTQISNNDQSGGAQVSALGAQKDQQFGKIKQEAQNMGELFSGFTPDQEAKYTGSTYLPALAKLQSTIAATRDTLLGKKADITTQGNTQALTVQQGQRKDLNDYNNLMEQEAQQARLAAQQQAFQASENAKNRSASASEAAANRAAAAAKAAPPPLATGLAQLFTGYVSAKNGGTPFYTENTIVPQLMASYGMSNTDAKKAALSFRKQNFGE